jgi:hypothetical protein
LGLLPLGHLLTQLADLLYLEQLVPKFVLAFLSLALEPLAAF